METDCARGYFVLFSSSIFLFMFLPATLLGYYVFFRNRTLRNVFLFFTSLFFYAWGEPRFVLIMLLSILLNYLFGIWIDKVRENKHKARVAMSVMLLFNISVFFVFKYLNFTIQNINSLAGDVLPQTNIVLPIGISFITFQAMIYVFDVYLEKGVAQKNPLYVGLYIAFFPQLIAGPIVRYETVADQIQNRVETWNDFTKGISRFIIGLSKKVLLSNTMAIVADEAFSKSDFSSLSVSFAWLGALAYSLQIFFDFSGYSDMAIGLGKMFGFHFEENFNYPYISASVSEFWRRWHISLGTWFRDYVYFPLGGSRVKSKGRLIRNLFVVWFLTGVWHGASWNFMIWGLGYFLLIAFEKVSGYPDKFKNPVLKQVYRLFTLLCVLGGWILFRAPTLKIAVKYTLSAVGAMGNPLSDSLFLLYLREYAVFFIFGLLLSLPFVSTLKRIIEKKKMPGWVMESLATVTLFILFIVSVSYLIKGTYNPFIYFNF